MKRNAHDFAFALLHRAEYREKSARGDKKSFVHSCWPRLVVMLVVVVLAAFVSLSGVRSVYAQSNCVLLCPPTPTPTPRPSPTPTPRPSPTPTPRPSPTVTPTPSPTPVVTPTPAVTPTPTPAASASPTATATPPEIVPTPGGGSAHGTPPTQGSGGNQAAGSDLLPMAIISGSVILVLLLSMWLGWLFIRRTLLPPVPAKLPPSGARPWSRFRVPNPNSLLPGVRAKNTPTYGPSSTNTLVVDSVPNDFPAPGVGGVSTGYLSASQPDSPPTISTDGSISALARTSGSLSSIEPGRVSDASLLATSHGGVAGPPGPSKKKKRGLLARAPYYSDLS